MASTIVEYAAGHPETSDQAASPFAGLRGGSPAFSLSTPASTTTAKASMSRKPRSPQLHVHKGIQHHVMGKGGLPGTREPSKDARKGGGDAGVTMMEGGGTGEGQALAEHEENDW